MIVPMKKVTLITLSSSASASLTVLRDLGVLHLEYRREPESADTERISAQKEIVQEALNVLSSRKTRTGQKVHASAVETAQYVMSLREERDGLHDRLQFIVNEIERLEPLGDFSPCDIAVLGEKGILAKIYQCEGVDLDRMEIPVPFEIVSSRGALKHILALNDGDFHLPLEEVSIPEKALSHLLREKEEVQRRIDQIEDQLDACAACVSLLEEGLASLGEQLQFAETLSAMGDEGGLSYLRGYCPANEVDRLRKTGPEMGWAFVIEDPSEEDEVPTLIKNPPWIRIIQLVFDFIGTVPGYREYDVSFWFLASLCLFFAMLIGDGGYGILFLAGTLTLSRKLKTLPSALFVLLYVFSAATVVWGMITGTWFGVEGLARVPILSGFVVSGLYSYADNRDFMIHLCFVIGTIHLTVAHSIRLLRHIHSLRVLAELGWISIVWFLYFLARNLVLWRPFPPLVVYLLPLGLFLTSAFSNPQHHFLKGFFVSLADLPLNVIRSFSDVVSYLRLFAVGYATLIVAMSFNQMASDFGWGSVPNAVGATLILLVGHTLNIVMACMAVLVHGIRLNMLEFSSHLGMTWSGNKFAPFRKQAQDRSVRTRPKDR